MKKFKDAIILKFSHAIRGFSTSIKEEFSLIIHFLATIIVVIVGAYSELTMTEWAIVVIVIGFVIGLEILNTGIENLVDLIAFQYDIQAKKVKDIGAAATLLNAILAVIVGLLIIAPKFIEKFQSSGGA